MSKRNAQIWESVTDQQEYVFVEPDLKAKHVSDSHVHRLATVSVSPFHPSDMYVKFNSMASRRVSIDVLLCVIKRSRNWHGSL